MKISVAIAISLCTVASVAPSETPKDQGEIQIVRSGSWIARQAPAELFTGSARVDSLFPAIAPAPTSGSLVTFEPGARTAWHTEKDYNSAK